MIYNTIAKDIKAGKTQLALLIDPENQNPAQLESKIKTADKAGVDFILVGGSLVSEPPEKTIDIIKDHTNIPVILFPGSLLQLSLNADAMLLLSLISGRNPDFLIGSHVTAAPFIKKSGIETISTGYILIDCGGQTSVHYLSNSAPIPAEKTDIITATALAGEMLGNKMIYLEAGSGAGNPVPEQVIRSVKNAVSVPLIAGGGIKNEASVLTAKKAGADIIIVGNSTESNPEMILRFSEIVRE